MRIRLALLLVSAGILATACTSSPSSSRSTSQASLTGTPLPAGPVPSEIAVMVCAKEAQSEISQALGVTADVKNHTWVNHLYSCTYAYPNGYFVLSVKELSSWAQTFSYYNGLASEYGKAQTLDNLGQGAFRAGNGDIVVRKDWKVLLVNIAGLPGEFGVPPTPATDVGYTVADLILACWAGD